MEAETFVRKRLKHCEINGCDLNGSRVTGMMIPTENIDVNLVATFL